jgi:hypothetical protein
VMNGRPKNEPDAVSQCGHDEDDLQIIISNSTEQKSRNALSGFTTDKTRKDFVVPEQHVPVTATLNFVCGVPPKSDAEGSQRVINE